MSDEDDRISVDFPDDVLVRRGLISENGRLERHRAELIGDWYVRLGDDPDSFSQDRDTRFTIGTRPDRAQAGMGPDVLARVAIRTVRPQSPRWL